jgi:hypothetical protein
MPFERPGTEGVEEEQGMQRLEQFIESTTKKYRAENVPITHDGRIDMLAYQSLYPDVVEDLSRTREGQLNAEELRQERLQSTGEKLEILAYAVFSRNIGEQFIVARSAPHDDRNGVDTILLDRETGNLVCAFDEVGDTTGQAYEKKLSVVQDKNKKGGASLKYGLGITQHEGKKEVIKTSAKNIPLFYLAVPKDRVEKGVREFLPDKPADFEEKLFAYFVATLASQVTNLELYSNHLNPDLKAKLTAFKKILNDLSLKRKKV